MGYTASEQFPDLIATMKKAAATLAAADVPVILGGGLAIWARGGPPTEHDVDFFVREADAEAGLQALAAAGMRTEHPPEGWLVKAHDGAILVDLIFRPAGGPIDDEYFRRAEPMEVMAQPMLVASVDDVLATKLIALTEQDPDFRPVLEIARSVREQIDVEAVRARTKGSPFARAFFALTEDLGITAPINGKPDEPVSAAALPAEPAVVARPDPAPTAWTAP